MIIAVISTKNEPRAAITPEIVKKLTASGHEVVIEKNLGKQSFIDDSDYEKVGGKIAKTQNDTIKNADIIIAIKLPSNHEEGFLEGAKSGTLFISLMNPSSNTKILKHLAGLGLELLSLELIPRTTRAQSMDVLSSQANLAGYRAVIEAANTYPCMFPMIMTAAGTVAPAKLLIIGAGVAGLQAIATAKRLGCIVSAFDVRSVAKEQVESLGGTFIEVDAEEAGDGGGGYAKEMSDDYKKKQNEKLAEVVKKSDIIITTAQIPGKPAPRLITKEMVESMTTKSVIIDLAAETGGNCELTKLDKQVEHKGIQIIGVSNMAGKIPSDASKLFAKNIYNLLQILIKDGKLNIDTTDDIIAASVITEGGKLKAKFS